VEVFFFVAIFVVIIGISWWSKHRQSTNWKTVAHEFGLQFIEGGIFSNPSMYGTYRGAQVNVETEVSGSGKNKSVYTVVEVALSGLVPINMEVYREGFFQKMGKAIGGDDIQVGDADLDKAFIIKGADEDKIRKLVTNPKVKARLLSAQSKYSTFRIDMGNVRVRESGRTSNMEKLRGYIRTVIAAANTIEEVCGAKPDRASQLHAAQSDQAGQSGQSGHPANQLAPPPAAKPPAAAGVSTVPFGRPAASEESRTEQTNGEQPSAPPAQPETAADDENDWW
jgi:hypothetical protein